MPSSKSAVLPDADLHRLLDDTLPKAHIVPKKLFKVKENANGGTTEWAACCKFNAVLSRVLDATEGRQLKMKPFTRQLGAWLSKEGYSWSATEVENAADGLRIMIRSLKSLKDIGLIRPFKGLIRPLKGLIRPHRTGLELHHEIFLRCNV